jgi:hypothetical protein
VASALNGIVIEVPVTENQLADAGAVLVRIDPRDYQAALAQAKAQVGTVWQRQGKAAEDIASILGRSKWADGSPADPALCQDWLMAIRVCRLAAGGSTLTLIEPG